MTKIAIVGDVHNHWSDGDATALAGLGVDLVLFVGDFGNEAVAVVRSVAALDLPKAVILGNHDAQYSATQKGKSKCPYDRTREDWVQLQIDLLGEAYVGYGCRDFPSLGLSVVGSRPFSWGGDTWKNTSFYQQRCDVEDFTRSAEKIQAAIALAAFETVIVLAHNGPTGLGETPESPCGKDWGKTTGDYGDPDLALALAQIPAGKQVPLVTFGHMHHSLRHRTDRERQISHLEDNRLYLNAACVPRIRQFEDASWHNFTIVTLLDGQVSAAKLVWVTATGEVVSAEEIR
jgi:uncharacterized protein (TIGR04168 family)